MTIAEKNRRYHAAHRDAILVRQRERRAVKKDADNARKAAYRLAHPDVIRQQTKALYYATPPNERCARRRRYHQKYAAYYRSWRDRNRERCARIAAEWARNNLGLKRAATARRLAEKIRATPAWADIVAIKAIYKEAARLTRETGVKHEVDHIIPLRSRVVCGLHVANNLQILTQTENRRKNNRLSAA